MGKHVLAKGFLAGSGFALGLIAVVAAAVTVGTVKTWTSGETLTASDLNTTISSLKTAIKGIPNWTESGSDAVYTDGKVGIGTTSPTALLTVSGGTIQLPISASAPYPCVAGRVGEIYFDTDVASLSPGTQGVCVCRWDYYDGQYQWTPSYLSGGGGAERMLAE
ncbi:MAG: hypothetical protein HYY13_02420 [Nitrospirae bacterium]|nr:hypothetical protein [Nitrospirota bacterium]